MVTPTRCAKWNRAKSSPVRTLSARVRNGCRFQSRWYSRAPWPIRCRPLASSSAIIAAMPLIPLGVGWVSSSRWTIHASAGMGERSIA